MPTKKQLNSIWESDFEYGLTTVISQLNQPKMNKQTPEENGFDKALATEIIARFATISGGRNGRWKEPMKKEFIDGALWSKEWQSSHPNTEQGMVYSYEDVKEALRNGVNIGIANVDLPRFEGDFNFNQPKSIEDCKEYLAKITHPETKEEGEKEIK